jgi:hypothetical protein
LASKHSATLRAFRPTSHWSCCAGKVRRRASYGRRRAQSARCLSMPAFSEQPLLEGDPVHGPSAVLGLYAPRGAASRPHEIARQAFLAHDADMAARALDLEHHGCCSPSFRAGRKKPPEVWRGRKFGDDGVGKNRGGQTPRRALILARRWHGRDGERAAEAAPSISAHALVSTFGTNNWPARAIMSCRSFNVRSTKPLR